RLHFRLPVSRSTILFNCVSPRLRIKEPARLIDIMLGIPPKELRNKVLDCFHGSKPAALQRNRIRFLLALGSVGRPVWLFFGSVKLRKTSIVSLCKIPDSPDCVPLPYGSGENLLKSDLADLGYASPEGIRSYGVADGPD